MASNESHYTLLYTCALALSIPCDPSSADSGTTISIFKLCPQCAPQDPWLIPTIFDQEHHDDAQAANASAAALAQSTPPSSGESSAASSMLLVPEQDKSSARSFVSSRSKSSTCSKVSSGFSKLRQLVSGPCRKPAKEEKRYREGEDAPYMASWLERTLERRARESEAELAKTAEEKRDEEKEREIGQKLDEVERELKLEKAMRIEQSLRVLV